MIVNGHKELIVPGNKQETILYAVNNWIETAKEAIATRGKFFVALSGGSTPSLIYQELAKSNLDFSRMFFFFSDERHVPPESKESNYKMAIDSGLSIVPRSHIFRMKGELDPEKAALEYEKEIQKIVPNGIFDLVMLGLGTDGHTASLFPKTHALHSHSRFCTANFIPEKSVWRLTLTFPCINAARNIAVYVLGKDKNEILKKVLYGPSEPDLYPAQSLGSESTKALFIADSDAVS